MPIKKSNKVADPVPVPVPVIAPAPEVVAKKKRVVSPEQKAILVERLKVARSVRAANLAAKSKTLKA